MLGPKTSWTPSAPVASPSSDSRPRDSCHHSDGRRLLSYLGVRELRKVVAVSSPRISVSSSCDDTKLAPLSSQGSANAQRSRSYHRRYAASSST